MHKRKLGFNRIIAQILVIIMLLPLFPTPFEISIFPTEPAKAANNTISNDQFTAIIGDLGQIRELRMSNNRTTWAGSLDADPNFVLPVGFRGRGDSTHHQWTGELIFATRNATSEAGLASATFREEDTNRTIAQGGSTTANNATSNFANNQWISKPVVTNSRVDVHFTGAAATATGSRLMRGYNVTSSFDMLEAGDGSLLWTIKIENATTDRWIEFGDIGIPLSFHDPYGGASSGNASQNEVYTQRLVQHSHAGIDSGYVYVQRPSGEGNYLVFAPVPESGARIEYVDQWFRSFQSITGERNAAPFSDWAHDQAGWQSGLRVYYIHSNFIKSTGAGYHVDNTSLILPPGESQTYQFKFFPVRTEDNQPTADVNANNRRSIELENNHRKFLYDNSMIDAIAVPSFQPALNMPTKLSLSYDKDIIEIIGEPRILCVHQEQCDDTTPGHVHGRDCAYNDPFSALHIPSGRTGSSRNVNNTRGWYGLHEANPGYTQDITLNKDKGDEGGFFKVNDRWHQVWDLSFACIGNTSLRIDYLLKVGDEWVPKWTQFEFNVLKEIDETVIAHSAHTVRHQMTSGAHPGLFRDYFQNAGVHTTYSRWGDDWSHDNVLFMTEKNLLIPDAAEIQSIERYITWLTNTMVHPSGRVDNFIGNVGYHRTFSELLAGLGYFGMYKIMRAYPDLVEYERDRLWYLEMARRVMMSGMSATDWGKYGEQEIPDVYEAMIAEGFSQSLITAFSNRWIRDRGRHMADTRYPYVSEFPFDNTAEESAYAAAQSLMKYRSGNETEARVTNANQKMLAVDMTTRAKRSIQPNWFDYGNVTFLGGESWWNFQYTTGLAASAMDDYLRYQRALHNYSADEMAWANRLNYAAKSAHFNSINMGQITGQIGNLDNFGATSWRYLKSKGGRGDQIVQSSSASGNNYSAIASHNGWNNYSGESELGIYGSMLRMSTDVVTDPIFGLIAYGGVASRSGNTYTVQPRDGFGRRLNFIQEGIYMRFVQDKLSEARVSSDASKLEFDIEHVLTGEHWSKINFTGGLQNGYYSISVDGMAQPIGQFRATNGTGVANALLPEKAVGQISTVTLDFIGASTAVAPAIELQVRTPGGGTPITGVPFGLEAFAYSDSDSTMTFSWAVTATPQDGNLVLADTGAALSTTSSQTISVRASFGAAGTYTVRVRVVQDGRTWDEFFDILVDQGAPINAPTISSVTQAQHRTKENIRLLTGVAVADPAYDNPLNYEWEVLAAPTGVAISDVLIGNKDSAEAMLLTPAPGAYRVSFKAIDSIGLVESAVHELTINVAATVAFGEVDLAIDGAQLARRVITVRGAAPTLPNTVDVIQSNGNVITRTGVTWDAVNTAALNAGGPFKVYGRTNAAQEEVAVVVIGVDSTTRTNFASVNPGTGSSSNPQVTSTSRNSASSMTVITGNTNGATSSGWPGDANTWHNWGNEGMTHVWIQYSFTTPYLMDQARVWAAWDSSNFRPVVTNIMLRGTDGAWFPAPGLTGPVGTATVTNTAFTTFTFEPVVITGMRLEMTTAASAGLGSSIGVGIQRFRSEGYTYTVDPAPTGDIESITVTPANPAIPLGGTQQFTATVTGTGLNNTARAVEWSVSGNEATGVTGTRINANGLLTVPATETADTLTVTATSTYQTDKSGSTTVTLLDPAAPVVAINANELAGINSGFNLSATATTGTGLPLTYAWSIAPEIEGNTIAGADTANPVITFTNYGTYRITVDVTDFLGQTTTRTVDVSVGDAAAGEPVNLGQTDVYTFAQGNIARNPAAQVFDANEANPGIRVSRRNTTAGTIAEQSLRLNDGALGTSTATTSWNTWGAGDSGATYPAYMTITWPEEYTIDSTRLRWWGDATGTGTSGVRLPGSAVVQYWTGTSWANVSNMRLAAPQANPGTLTNTIDVTQQSSNANNRNTWRSVTFDPVTTTRLRVEIARHASSGGDAGIGASEWEIFEARVSVAPPADKTALLNAILRFETEDGSLWTEESWDDAVQAYDAAMAVFLDGEADEDAVAGAAQALNDALGALETASLGLFEDLIAYYIFDQRERNTNFRAGTTVTTNNQLRDYSAMGNHGIIGGTINNASGNNSGWVASGYKFTDATSGTTGGISWVETPNSANLVNGGHFTAVANLTKTGEITATHGLWSWKSVWAAGNPGFWMNTSGGAYLRHDDGTTATDLATNIGAGALYPVLNQPSEIAYSVDARTNAATGFIAVNGEVLSTSVPQRAIGTPTGYDYRFGNNWSGTGRDEAINNATIHKYMVFNRALTEEEVALLNTGVLDPVTVTYSAGVGGTISAVQPAGALLSGYYAINNTPVTFTAVPTPGFNVESWSVNGVVRAGRTDLTFTTTVSGDTVVAVTFEQEDADPDRADYTAVFEALAKANEVIRELFTEESLAKLDAAVAAVVPNLPLADQPLVDAFAVAIEQAIAQLERIYTITLNLNGGEFEEGATFPGTYITGMELTLPALLREGYKFDGWFDNAGLAGDPVAGITATDAADKEFWAKWTQVPIPAGLTATAYTIGALDGTITGTTAAMEISRSASGPWAPAGEGYTTGLMGGVYFVRAAATADAPASLAASVEIPYAQVPGMTAANLAGNATPAAHFTLSDGSDARLSAINDGGVPTLPLSNNGFIGAGSAETDARKHAWHDWSYYTNNYTAEDWPYTGWLTYEWEEPVTVYQSRANYFADGTSTGEGAGIRVPQAVYFEYWDGDAWQPVEGPLGPGTAPVQADRGTFVEVTFEPITTTRVRMNMVANGRGIGCFEWELLEFAEAEEPANYGAVNAAIEAAEAINRDLYTTESLAKLDAAIADVVTGLPAAEQATVDAFAEAINKAFDALIEWQLLTTFRLKLNAITRVSRNSPDALDLTEAIEVNQNAKFDMANVTFTVSNAAMAVISADGTSVSTLNRAGTVTLTATYTQGGTNFRSSVTLMIT